ncbi:MAG TPA: hypothetical protein VJG29_00405 [Candidatus Paceibacterota bacterium]
MISFEGYRNNKKDKDDVPAPEARVPEGLRSFAKKEERDDSVSRLLRKRDALKKTLEAAKEYAKSRPGYEEYKELLRQREAGVSKEKLEEAFAQLNTRFPGARKDIEEAAGEVRMYTEDLRRNLEKLGSDAGLEEAA